MVWQFVRHIQPRAFQLLLTDCSEPRFGGRLSGPVPPGGFADANDAMYALDASRGDDQVNPPELGSLGALSPRDRVFPPTGSAW
jgi:hypothetical protein